jgi:hypothetical protein
MVSEANGLFAVLIINGRLQRFYGHIDRKAMEQPLFKRRERPS